MKQRRKALGLLLALVMVVGLLPVTGQAATEYDLWVGGERVTSDKLSDTGWSYTPETNTLTLTSYSSNGHYIETVPGVYDPKNGYRIAAGIYYAGTEKLTVELQGDNTLTMPAFSEDRLDNAAIFSKGDITFTGAGTLNATGGNASDSSDESNVGSFGICSNGRLTFDGSGTLAASGGIGESSYGLFIDALTVNSGTATFSGAINAKVKTKNIGIRCEKDITVTGGNVTATGGTGKSSYGIYGIFATKSNVIVSGGTLKATSGIAEKESCGIYSGWGGVNVSGGGHLTAEGGAVTGDSGRSCGINNGIYGLIVGDGTLIAKGGDVTGAQGQSIGLCSTVGPLDFEASAQVTCEGGKVTGDQGESFGVNCAGFYMRDGQVKATGGAADHSCGVYYDLSIDVAAGTLTASGGAAKRSHGIYGDSADMEVNGGAVKATGGEAEESCGVYLTAREYGDGSIIGFLTVTGGELTATGGSCGVFCDQTVDDKMIVITGGTTMVTGNTAALSKAPILGVDVTARGSSQIDGNGSVEYIEADNNTYKWFKTVGAPGDKTHITKVAFTVEEPVAGAVPVEKVQITTEPEGAMRVQEYDAVWLESEDGMSFTPMTTPIFEAGKHYAVERPTEKNAGGPLVALAASGYKLPTEPEPTYTLNGEEILMIFSFLDSFGPLEERTYSVSVDPASVTLTAQEDYDEEQVFQDVTATSTGTGEVTTIAAGLKEASMYERFEVIASGMTATVRPKAGLKAGTYTATVVLEDLYDRFAPIDVPVTFTVTPAPDPEPTPAPTYSVSVAPASVTLTAQEGYDEEQVFQDITATSTGTGEVTTIAAGLKEAFMYEQFEVIASGMTATVRPKAGLKAGTYTATVVLEDLYDRFAPIDVPVTFTVTPAPAPEPTPAPTYGVSVAPASVTLTAQEGYDEERLYQDITATSTGTGEVTIIAAGLKEAFMYEQFEVIASGMTATVRPKAGLTAGTYKAVVVIEDIEDRFAPIEVPVTFTVTAASAPNHSVPGGHTVSDPRFPASPEEVIGPENPTEPVEPADPAPVDPVPPDPDLDHDCPSEPYQDVDTGKWYHEAIDYVIKNKLMNGFSATEFRPDVDLSRAMLATILYRMEGSPAVAGELPFPDVTDDSWYTDAVRWAAENGIVKGYDDETFRPDRSVSRQEMVVMMQRYAAYKGIDVRVGEETSILSYVDAFDVGEWAMEAMQWACGVGLIEGTNDNRLDPEGNTTRAQAAAILMRFAENVLKA